VQRGAEHALVFSGYLPFDQLPQVHNPPSGFVYNTNTTPFRATAAPGNPDPADFPASAGIERTLNNRGLRSLQLFGGDAPISGEAFLRFKFDRTYARGSRMFTAIVDPPSISAPAGALVVTLTWDAEADLDLHVEGPGGEEIYHAKGTTLDTFSPGEAGDGGSYGYLDFDSHAGCTIDSAARAIIGKHRTSRFAFTRNFHDTSEFAGLLMGSFPANGASARSHWRRTSGSG